MRTEKERNATHDGTLIWHWQDSADFGVSKRTSKLPEGLHTKFLYKALAKRTRKSTQVLDLRSTCVSFGHRLALTCVDLLIRLARA